MDPLLIFAGAGSGRRACLPTAWPGSFASAGAPAHILAVTFTNKAAKEMKVGLPTWLARWRSIWIGTFHALAARMLRMYGEHIGLDPGFVIYDDKDQEDRGEGVLPGAGYR